MTDFVRAYLIINTILLVIVLAWDIVVTIKWVKKEKKHKLEKAELQKQKDYHCKELEKRYGIENESIGYDLGERGNKI